MNAWLIAAAVVLFSLVPCGVVCFRGKPADRLVGLETASTLIVILLALLSEGFHRVPFFDLPLTLALLGFGGSLVFARFLERWL